MTLNIKSPCTILLSLLTILTFQAVHAQDDQKSQEVAQTLSKVFIAAPKIDEKSELPPTLVAPSIRLGEEGTPSEQLIRASRLITEYLQPLTEGQGGELISEFIAALKNNKGINGVGAISEADLVNFGTQLISELAKVSNTILPLDYDPSLASKPNGSSYFSFAAFSLVALLNDLKCNVLGELVKAVGQNLVDVAELAASIGTMGDSAYCEVPRLGKISNWAFNPEDRTGKFSLEDMKVDRYRIFDKDTASSAKVEYTLVDQLSYDWDISINAYDVSILRSKEDYEAAISIDVDADPFYEPIPPQVLDDSVAYPSLPVQAKDLDPDNKATIWNRNLRLRIFSHGVGIVPEKVVRTHYDIIYKEAADVVLDKADDDAAALKSKLDKNEASEPNVFEDINKRKFYRFISAGSSPEELDESHPFRQVSKESCIDIMFDAGTVPLTLDDFPEEQPGWCLGRCAHPLIANSK